MRFALNEKQEAMRTRARKALEFVEAERASFRESIIRRNAFPTPMWDALANAGFFGAVVPEAYGGTGDGLLGMALASEALGATGYGSGLPALTTMATVAIDRCGSEALKQELLPKLARGELKICIGATEEKAGLNTFRIETHARQEGDAYVINGQKMYTSGADIADYILLFTRTMTVDQLEAAQMPKTIGLSLFLVDAQAPGITRTPIPAHGEVGMNTYVTVYENVAVPASRMVGEENQGTLVLLQMMNPERLLFAAAATGVVEYCIERACAFAKERTVFRDTPIGRYQAIQHPLADLAMRNEAARMLVYRGASAHDAGGDPLDIGFYANSAKYLAGELAVKAVDTAIETFGGRGFNEDYDIIHLWALARLLKSSPISPEMILNFVAEHRLGLPRSY